MGAAGPGRRYYPQREDQRPPPPSALAGLPIQPSWPTPWLRPFSASPPVCVPACLSSYLLWHEAPLESRGEACASAAAEPRLLDLLHDPVRTHPHQLLCHVPVAALHGALDPPVLTYTDHQDSQAGGRSVSAGTQMASAMADAGPCHLAVRRFVWCRLRASHLLSIEVGEDAEGRTDRHKRRQRDRHAAGRPWRSDPHPAQHRYCMKKSAHRSWSFSPPYTLVSAGSLEVEAAIIAQQPGSGHQNTAGGRSSRSSRADHPHKGRSRCLTFPSYAGSEDATPRAIHSGTNTILNVVVSPSPPLERGSLTPSDGRADSGLAGEPAERPRQHIAPPCLPAWPCEVQMRP